MRLGCKTQGARTRAVTFDRWRTRRRRHGEKLGSGRRGTKRGDQAGGSDQQRDGFARSDQTTSSFPIGSMKWKHCHLVAVLLEMESPSHPATGSHRRSDEGRETTDGATPHPGLTPPSKYRTISASPSLVRIASAHALGTSSSSPDVRILSPVGAPLQRPPRYRRMPDMVGVVPALRVTSYHERVRDVLREHERGLWNWFASDQFGAEHAQRVQLELLKQTYRLDPSSHPELHQRAESVASALGFEAPVTFYQASDSNSMNAGLCFVPGEAHVVFAGPVLTRLEPVELDALLGHELAHFRLWTDDDGAFRVADNLLEAVVARVAAPPSWIQLALRHRRYTEIYADRGSLVACGGDLHAAVRCLLKVSTGIDKPDAAAYMRQVDEVLGKSADASAGETHPELFLRAWAMAKWLDVGDAADGALVERVEGPLTLESLDLLGQHALTTRTRDLVRRFLRPAWARTDGVLAHSRQFFDDGTIPADLSPAGDSPTSTVQHDSVKQYLSYVLLDLATADPDLDEVAIAAALALADAYSVGDAFKRSSERSCD